ncbi:jg12511 [Pararge aegeria aegeria]|uniref:Jg12511 protein n=1 Tax=Pararge aegeria aegeria TaxID=348720 RepID=A0A8S4R790_9NEOP|nr:jg12511 [Pararge aegeria aegeria]
MCDKHKGKDAACIGGKRCERVRGTRASRVRQYGDKPYAAACRMPAAPPHARRIVKHAAADRSTAHSQTEAT